MAASEYAGRQAGTPGYAKAVTAIESRMKANGMSPVFGNGKFRLSSAAEVASLTKEQVSINGKTLTLMKDYMPYSRTAEGRFAFSDVYDAGAGKAGDYKGKIKGVALFRWFDKDGKFPEGALDRIQRAIAQGATGVLIIANGELKVGNYEHPLNGASLKVPVLYISEEAAKRAGFSSGYQTAALTNQKIDIQLSVSRNAGSADNLIGVIPGKQEKAVLWVTNIDGFGSLPDGRSYESAKSGSAAAAMMLDMARYYAGNQPEYTQLFAFVGGKWKGQEGISALAGRLNFDNIAATVDLYAMGGSGRAEEINIGYTDPSFETFAKAVANRSYYNNDLGNSLSGVLKSKTKRLLMVRDRDTWVDDSMTDKASAISPQRYEAGVNSLLDLADRIMVQTAKEDSAPFDYASQKMTTVTFDSPKLTLGKTQSKHYTIYADEQYRGQITQDVLKGMDETYERIAYYNYYPKSGQKIIALFMKDGNAAAIIAGRKDLEGRSEAAGGGFANVNPKDGNMYIYMRSGPALGTVAHESNHALASVNPYAGDNFELQEWQGQSHIVRYSYQGSQQTYMTDPVPMMDMWFKNNNEVSGLTTLISDYKTAMDWAWFTKRVPNPKGHLYTYYTAGSMYAFLNYRYGAEASRRAMYRNYEDATRFQSNLIADTGLSLDGFLQAWRDWFASPDAILASSGNGKASGKEFDYKILYTLPEGSGGNESAENTGQGALPGTTVKAGVQGNIRYAYEFASKDLSIVSLKLAPVKTGAQFVIVYKSKDSRYINIFNPPQADRLLKFQDRVAKPVKGQATITLTQEEVRTMLDVGRVSIKFGNFNDFVYLNSSDCAKLLRL